MYVILRDITYNFSGTSLKAFNSNLVYYCLSQT